MGLNKIVTLTLSLIAVSFMSACSDDAGGSGANGNRYEQLRQCQDEARIQRNNGTLTSNEYTEQLERCDDLYRDTDLYGSVGGYEHVWTVEGINGSSNEAMDNYLKTTYRCDIGNNSFGWFGGFSNTNDCDNYTNNIRVEIRTKTLGTSSQAVIVVEAILGQSTYAENYDLMVEDILYYNQPYLLTTLQGQQKRSIVTILKGDAILTLGNEELGFQQKGLHVTFVQNEIKAESATVNVRFNGELVGQGTANYSKYSDKFFNY